LVIGSESLLGLTQTSNESVDLRFVEDLVGSGVRKTGQLLTLDYEEILETSQPYATKVVNVAPFRSTFYAGTIELFPASDVWIDQVRLEPTSIKVEGNFSETLFQLSKEGFDTQTGFGPVTWNSWEYTWTGESKETDVQKYKESGKNVTKTTVTTTKTGTRTKEGTRQIATEEYNNKSFGDSVVSLDLIPYMRSRNIEFTAKRMKPFTRVYNFFDNVDVTEYCTPKLLEISMLSGTFIVGEIVQAVTRRSIALPLIPRIPTPVSPGIPTRIPVSATYVFKSYRKPTTVQINQQSSLFTSISITNRSYFPPPEPTKRFSFRVAAPNHKYGPYNRPTDIFTTNPYNRDVPLETSYSESSTILNVDTYSLANMVQSRFKGHAQKGMILKGVTSGATAVVTDVRLVTDNVGTLIGSFNIPNPNNASNPKFQTGIKLFRMTNSEVNTKVGGLVVTSAEERFYAEGTQTNVKENILVTRDLRIEPVDVEETEAATDVSADVSYVRVPIPPPPAPAPSPPAGGCTENRGGRLIPVPCPPYRGTPRSSGSSPNVRPVVDVYNSTSSSIAGTTVGGVTFNRDGTVSNGVYLGNGQWDYKPGATGATWTGTNGNSSAGKPVYQTGRGSSSYSGPRSGPTYSGRTTGSGQAY
jgi:hypothetical protein